MLQGEYNQNVKKILYSLFVMMVMCASFLGLFNFSGQKSYAYVNNVRVIYDKANIYSRQDFLSLTSTELENCKIKIATLDEVFAVIEEYDNIYKIEVDQTQGYILKSMVIDASASSPIKKLDYNAQIICDTQLYQKENDNFKPLEKQIQEGTKVCITGGYNQKNEYTLITFYSNNSIVNAYVKTEVLKVDGLNGQIFIYISVIVTVVTIIICLIKIFNSKNKKKKSRA